VWKAWLTGIRVAVKPALPGTLDDALDRVGGAADDGLAVLLMFAMTT
jgi:hypothetical protein